VTPALQEALVPVLGGIKSPLGASPRLVCAAAIRVLLWLVVIGYVAVVFASVSRSMMSSCPYPVRTPTCRKVAAQWIRLGEGVQGHEAGDSVPHPTGASAAVNGPTAVTAAHPDVLRA